VQPTLRRRRLVAIRRLRDTSSVLIHRSAILDRVLDVEVALTGLRPEQNPNTGSRVAFASRRFRLRRPKNWSSRRSHRSTTATKSFLPGSFDLSVEVDGDDLILNSSSV